MRILLIKRSAVFSPNMQDKDEAIITSVRNALEESGVDTSLISEEEVSGFTLPFQAIAHMARSQKALQWIKEQEEMGIPVVNNASCLLSINRRTLLSVCSKNGISVPAYACSTREGMTFPFWWKRDDRVSQQSDDVMLVHDEEEWSTLEARGCKEYVTEAHITGDLIKFYGVRGSGFFHWTYPTYSKFGKEDLKSKPFGYTFAVEEMKEQVNKLASAIGMDVFGGDAIIDDRRVFYIIDFNDWPSFSPCVQEASRAIADLIITKTNGQ